jgi:phosphatidate cytidylyltransferase
VADFAARRNLALRLVTAALGVPFILWLLYEGPSWAFPAVAAFMCALAARELFAMVAPGDARLAVVGVPATLVVFGLVALPALRPHTTHALVGMTLAALSLCLSRSHPPERAALRMGWVLAGPLYVGGLFGTIADLFRYPSGGSWVVLCLICSFFSDTGGYFVGQRWGKHALHPVSPNKTVEGSIGGLFAALLGGLAAHYLILPQLPIPSMLALCAVATLLGQLGDLAESLIKRSVGVKDSGTILPGHGGVLDRCDAMLFSSATIWAYVTLLT